MVLAIAGPLENATVTDKVQLFVPFEARFKLAIAGGIAACCDGGGVDGF